MKTRTLSRILALMVPLTAGAQVSDPCPDADVSAERLANGALVIRWHAAAGTSRLYHAESLGDPATWKPVTGEAPLPDNYWQVQVSGVPARGFFKVAPAVTPESPPGVRLVMDGDHFRLEWDSSCDASGYVVYVRETPDGPPVRRLVLPLANALEITGLNPGQLYFISLAAVNPAGEGAPAAAQAGVFGPKGPFTGRAVRSFSLPGGAAFEVEAEGAELTLFSPGMPAALDLRTTADEAGQFSIRQVPPGAYLAGWAYAGQKGSLASPVMISPKGLVMSPLVLPSGPQPPPPGSVIIGTLTMSGGEAPRINVPEFQLRERATITASFADGTSRTVIPDRLGAWALTEITGGYPVTIKAAYQNLTVDTVIPSPQQELAPVALQFPGQLPRIQRLTIMQGGQEVNRITEGVPVTFVPEIDDPDQFVDTPRWIIEHDGHKYLSMEPNPTLLFGGSPDGTMSGSAEGGVVRVRFISSRYVGSELGPFLFDLSTFPLTALGIGCWSGVTGSWNPAAPDDILSAHPATITVTHSGVFNPTVAGTNLNQNGVSYFEMPLDPKTVPPYLMRVDKTDCMRFLWPFEFQLPKEATFCVVPATVTSHAQSSGGPLTVTHSTGAVLSIPWGSLTDPANVPWLGNVVVRMVVWDPLTKSPLPPGAEVRGPGLRKGIFAYSGVWFDIATPGGVSLTPDTTATLTLPTASTVYTVTTMPCHHQVESTGYFERWGTPTNDAVKVAPGRYRINLGTKGTFLLAWENDLMEPVFEADRSLNYPFEMRIGKSIFPITVTGACTHSLGHLYMPRAWGVDAQVLDLLHGPGLHYSAPAIASFSRPVEPMRKPMITKTFNNLVAPVAVLPAITPVWVRLTMANAEPSLKTLPSDTTVTGVAGANQFLSRHLSTASDAAAYYAKIKAPATLALWRTLNGFPATFGASLPGVGVDRYATAYYYNLGDLGFARAQTMRILTSPIDGQFDVAFAVTNYPTLEDARCRRSPIATVCMDYALRTDQGTVTPARYTRFYTYNGAGNLLDCADLDGAGLKYMPNLCIICHGGSSYTAGGTANLGSRFLPFDLESYSFHPKYGVQKQEIAAMNYGVTKTGANATILDLITGWYGNANPLASFSTWNGFNQSYAPVSGGSSWSGQTSLYSTVFKHGCRVCHISRDSGGIQFAAYSDLSGFGFGSGSVCSGLSMPHSQRTWGAFWGSRGSNKLGVPGVPDYPTLLGTAAGVPCRP